MNKLQVLLAILSLCLLMIVGQCSPVFNSDETLPGLSHFREQMNRQRRFDETLPGLSHFREQMNRQRRFNILTYPNEKRSDFDDPRFLSSAYGKRSGGRGFNSNYADFFL
uniref:Uncharacterized protein n=1 Tax=Panagrolaimus sp. JU765 TaxID=591449 RepID=A0AC34R356_9BILA